MKRLLLSHIICVFITLNLSAQDRKETGNTNADLMRNKVATITWVEYYYKDIKKKLLFEPGRKIETQIFDSLGRNIETIYFNDSTGQISARYKYFYADSIGRNMYRWEYYNDKGSLKEVSVAREQNGQMVYMVLTEGSSCFGNYKFIYNDKGLIDEAIWYGPKEGIWANDNMIPVYTRKLIYTFNP